jgi:hypothetical protein
MKAYEGVEVQLHSLLTSALNGGVCADHAPAALSPEKDQSVPDKQEAGWTT